MGGVVSKVFGRGYRTNEQGSTNVPADTEGFSPPQAQEAGSDAALLVTADAPVGVKQQSKHDASAPLAAAAAAQEEGVAGGTNVQDAASPTKAKSDASVPTGEGGKSSLSKKPSVLGTAKEDVLGVLESVKKNVGAAKEAFFERQGSKHELTKGPSSPTKTTAPLDEKQAEPCKTPEAKTGGFFAKLGFSKPDEQLSKDNATGGDASKPPETGKNEGAAVLQKLSKQASVPAQAPSSDVRKDKNDAETPATAVGAADAIKQTCQEGLAVGTAQAEALKKASEETLNVAQTKVQQGPDSGGTKAELIISAGKAGVEDLKQKTQDAAEAVKSKVAAAEEQARHATDAALNKAGELKDTVPKAADAAVEKAGSLAQQAQESATAAVDYLGKKTNDAVQFGTAQAAALVQQVQGAVSAQADDVKESAAEAKEGPAAAAAEKVKDITKAAEEAVSSVAARVPSAAVDAKQALESEAEKLNATLQQAKPAVLKASAGAEQVVQEIGDAVKSGGESLKAQLQQAPNAASSGVLRSAPVEASAEPVKETTQEADHHKPQEEPPAIASSPTKQQSLDDMLSAGKARLESFGQQVKSVLSEELHLPEVKELDAEAPKEQVLAASNAGAVNAGEGTKELTFQSKEKSRDTADTTKLFSQEALDSAKSEAELLVERVISSVVGASESLTNDAVPESDKDRLALLKEKAQQEFALCQEKAHQLLADASSAVSEAASTVATKSVEVCGAAKSKAHSVSEQVAAVASDTAESLKQGVQTLQEQAASKAKESPCKPVEATETSGTCASEVPQDQCREEPAKAAPLFPTSDQHEEHGGDRPSPIPKLDDIESAVVKIQAGVRGYLTRKNLQFRPPQDDEPSKTTENGGHVEQGSSEPLETEAAATKIQAAFRGYMVRKELKPDNGPGALHKEERELVESR